jgi:hypothetical protein
MLRSRLALVAGSLAFALMTLAAPSARSQTVLWADDFEDGPGQWATTGLWHWIRDTNDCAAPALPFPTATHCMWYGIDSSCNFDNGSSNFGYMASMPPVALPQSAQVPVLRYKRWRSAEGCGSQIGTPYDWTQVTVSAPGFPSVIALECDSAATWRKGRVDLGSLQGGAVTVVFRLDTQDDQYNEALGLLIDDVVIQLEPGRSYCEVAGCPCPVASFPPHTDVGGCFHSQTVLTGAELLGSGTPSVVADDVVLAAVDMPATSSVTFLQGSVLPSGVVFGDGLRCIGGSLLRIATRPVVGGTASYPAPGDVPLSIKGLIPAGGATVGYQAHYRDSADHCTPATFNLSNGYRVLWIP